VNVPGANPSNLVVALGKDGNAYLANRDNLGGVSVPVARSAVSSGAIRQAAATYRTALGTYVVLNGNSTSLISFRITPTAPPTIANAWTASENGGGSPFVTSTDGTNNMIVWGLGAEGDQRLHAFNGDTAATVFNGGGANELMTGTRHFNTAIVARGRIYVGNDNQVYAFSVPVPPINLTNMTLLPGGSVQFAFTNTPGLSFTAFATTNVSQPFPNWTRLGAVTEVSPGQFEFTDTLMANSLQRFYRIRSP